MYRYDEKLVSTNDPSGMPSLREAAPTARQGRTPVPYGGKPLRVRQPQDWTH
ncbi:hypothetical protein [Nostoc sp. MS1]|uniref:hypothetical protein n=1 Tax=Nostoc sp. MS1 TaxID=2764711 RepID=UPI001CC3F716|nr:hypothetical protein [Nostoc sp. MS1]